MPFSARHAWLVLAHATGVGPRTCGALVRAFGGPSQVLAARREHLARVPGVGPARASALAEGLTTTDPRRVETAAREAGLEVLTPADPAFPAALLADADPPPALWFRGRWPEAARPHVAVVGTRAASPYGLRVARTLAEDLARAGVVVVSGLARGIDAAAHAGALHGGGLTVAVLGCGADVVYPPEHAALVDEIAGHGAVVSEHPPGTPPRQAHFPRRNRIVASLARALVVVEAAERSGALLTARLAVEAGRDVFAVPGPIDRGTHLGCHRLLRQGASLCEGAADLLASWGEPAPTQASPRLLAFERPPPPPGPALVVHAALDRDEPLDLDALVLRTGLSPDEVAAAVTRLELDGHAVHVPGAGIRRAD